MATHPNRSKTCRPREHLRAAGRRYPAAWKQVDEFRAGRRRGLPDWPEWCFLPLAAAYAIVSDAADVPVLDPDHIGDVGRLGALAAWRVTQGVYRFDPDLYRALVDTPVSGHISSDVLHRLPEWCVYIETAGLSFLGLPAHGFFAHLEQDANTGREELRLLIDTDEALSPLPLHLGAGGLDEALDEMAREARKQAVARELPAPGNIAPDLRPAVEPMVSLLLYLCSQNAEIGDGTGVPRNPRPKRTKRGWRLFAADKPTTWDIGVRTGESIRGQLFYEQ